MKLNSYKELIVWQRAMELVEEVYALTADFSGSEKSGIISQIRRASVSIPSNIAEGYGRRSHKEYLQFYAIAYGSALELETQLIISEKLGFASKDKYTKVGNLLVEVIKMLYVMTYGKKVEGISENSQLYARPSTLNAEL